MMRRSNPEATIRHSAPCTRTHEAVTRRRVWRDPEQAEMETGAEMLLAQRQRQPATGWEYIQSIRPIRSTPFDRGILCRLKYRCLSVLCRRTKGVTRESLEAIR